MYVLTVFNAIGNVLCFLVLFPLLIHFIGYALILYVKQYRWAVNYYSLLLRIMPASAALYLNRSWAFLCLREYDQAIADCDKALLLNTDYAMVYNNRSAAWLGLKRYQDALRDAHRALTLNSNLGVAYYNRAVALAGLDQCELAFKDIDQAIARRPRIDTQYFVRANCHLRVQSYQQAILDYTETIALNRRAWNAYHNRGYTYFAMGEIERGVADLLVCCECDTRNLIHHILLESYKLCMYPVINAAVVENFESLAFLDTEDGACLHFYRGIVACLQGQYETALSEFELDIADMTSNLQDRYFWVGMTCLAMGRSEEARRAIDYALQHGLPRFFLKLLLLWEREHADFIADYIELQSAGAVG